MNENEKIAQLQKELENIKQRNQRVEIDKAWETSKFRIGIISLITYLTASIFLYIINVENFYYAALIPTLGFMISTLSLPAIKKIWQQYFKSKL